jgi:hypothetical protein
MMNLSIQNYKILSTVIRFQSTAANSRNLGGKKSSGRLRSSKTSVPTKSQDKIRSNLKSKNTWIPPFTEDSRFYSLNSIVLVSIFRSSEIGINQYKEMLKYTLGTYEHYVVNHGITEGSKR